MLIFKCKMCGGSLNIEEGKSVATCDYCGTKQTLPKLNDDRRANLYDRANHFRRNNEFDKAMGIYEQILAEDNTDSEAYWSRVLCRYGIEYVEDPATRRRVPTVNRTQYTSIFDDADYKAAIEYGDLHQRKIYEEEAKAINEIQKGILSISQEEEPFDIFICYKETDDQGRRTQDSVLANDLYHQLNREGFKVFFSRITLEDKLGSAYEPYIFAALNSAKVMVVMGTKAEYFNAVWVRNEWSRYLALIKDGSEKFLIPAYRDMDPYDLPEEFSHLQAQDMSKLGFMQDLIRGIKKITATESKKPQVTETVVVGAGSANLDSLLDRASLFLEDGDWASADQYCERVLDQDPRNAQAYLGKLMAEFRVEHQGGLADCAEPFEENSNYQKAVRFADDNLKAELTGYNESIRERNEHSRLDAIYNDARMRMDSITNESGFKEIAAIFAGISGWHDSDILAKICVEKAEEARKDTIYDAANNSMQSLAENDVERAIELFESIPNWRDSRKKISECRKKISTMQQKSEKDRLKTELRKKKTKRVATIAVSSIVVAIAFIVTLNMIIIPESKYNRAEKAFAESNYDKAIILFAELVEYKDSAERIWEAQYSLASSFLAESDYDNAIAQYAELGGYRDSAEQVLNAQYAKALFLLAERKYDEASDIFDKLGDYSDSATMVLETNYQKAISYYDSGNYYDAVNIFKDLSGYSESIKYLFGIAEITRSINDDFFSKYTLGVAYFSEGNYEKAYDTFSKIGSYPESIVMAKESKYQVAVSLYKSGDYKNAANKFEELENYSDSAKYYSLSMGEVANDHFDAGVYDEALKAYQLAGKSYYYRQYECAYILGQEAQNLEQWEKAIEYYESIGPDFKQWSVMNSKLRECYQKVR